MNNTVLTENQMDYSIPVFAGTHDKEMDTKKVPVTLKYADPDSNLQRDEDDYLVKEDDQDVLNDVNPNTERVRRYYKRHPKKVRQYLRSTVDDRVARNRDRRKAIKKHGKKKMKNHDVHHPDGPHGGTWKLAKKDHGPDKKKPTKTKRPTAKKVDKKEPTPSKRTVSKPTKKISKQTISRDLLTQIQLFVRYVVRRLNIKDIPTITVIPPTDDMTSLGKYNPSLNQVFIVVKNRLLADILRTLAHELVHRKQDEMGQLTNISVDGSTGSPVENYAHIVAGIIMRDYGKMNNQIFLKEETIPDDVIEPEDIEIQEQEADIYHIVQDMVFQDTTKKPICYTKHSDIEEPEHLDSMPQYTYAVNLIPNFKVETTVSSGKETTNIANVNDIIMCGPSKEKYVLTKEKFDSFYLPIESGPPGTVIPDQSVRKVAHYEGTQNVTFVAPWGEETVLYPGDYLVKTGNNDFYRIAKEEYELTYNPPGITESKPELPEQEKPIAVLPGKFQPFESSHYVSYLQLVKEFGKDRTFIATSNKQDAAGKSPFTFDQKKKIMTKMFGIPEESIIEVQNPYKPIELTKEFAENTPIVFAVSEADSTRMGKNYFKPYVKEEYKSGYRQTGYTWIKPVIENKRLFTGAQIRHIFGNKKFSERAKQEIFSKLYRSFDSEIFEMIQNVSAKAEEDRVLTLQYKKNKENLNKDSVTLFENKNEISSNDLAPYKFIRKYTKEDLKNAIDEFFNNVKTFAKFKNLAKDKIDFLNKVKNGSKQLLSIDDLMKLNNSDVSSVLSSKTPTEVVKKLASEIGKEKFKNVLQAIKNKEKLPLPIVIKTSDEYYLLDGNTRLVALAAMRQTMPVLLITYSQEPSSDINKLSKKDKDDDSDKKIDRQKNKELLDKLLQMKITNPKTGNLIKLDTAMDYERTHPAHTMALNMIRYYMKDFSSRAGVAKKLRYT